MVGLELENEMSGIIQGQRTEHARQGQGAGEKRKRDPVCRFGNYPRYYGYRLGRTLDEDPRLQYFQKEWFEGKDCLDIGCNEGFITISVAQKYCCRRMLGVDIDEGLIRKALSNLEKAAAGAKVLEGKLLDHGCSWKGRACSVCGSTECEERHGNQATPNSKSSCGLQNRHSAVGSFEKGGAFKSCGHNNVSDEKEINDCVLEMEQVPQELQDELCEDVCSQTVRAFISCGEIVSDRLERNECTLESEHVMEELEDGVPDTGVFEGSRGIGSCDSSCRDETEANEYAFGVHHSVKGLEDYREGHAKEARASKIYDKIGSEKIQSSEGALEVQHILEEPENRSEESRAFTSVDKTATDYMEMEEGALEVGHLESQFSGSRASYPKETNALKCCVNTGCSQRDESVGTVDICKGTAFSRSVKLLQTVQFRYENFIENFPHGDFEKDGMFDTVLCMSVTKWIHLNWGDEGLICLFAKIYRILRPGGILVLEPQPWKSYKSKQRVSPITRKHFYEILLRPQHFTEILLDKVGFKSVQQLSKAVPDSSLGFSRGLYLYIK